jgi:carbamoyl-phosphate synthase small subunit
VTERPAHLVLADGTVLTGAGFGAQTDTTGEVVFNTSMTGYQEMLTDPSYAGQILVPTYPLQGNYGTTAEDVESRQVQVSAFIVRGHSPTPSHYNSEGTLDAYLKAAGIPGISGVDTRMLTRRIRSHGVLMGAVTWGDPGAAAERLRALPAYDTVNFVERVSVAEGYEYTGKGARQIVVVDCGVKHAILRYLAGAGCRVHVLPSNATAEEVLALRPHGVLFSPGPGDPVHNGPTVATAKAVMDKVPVMGICLGHQIIARALGAETYKLKFGHRGGNHPVQELATGRVSITAQNHGYAVADEGLPDALRVSHRNLNDGTIEGLEHRELPVLTIQYHSEASPGPLDNQHLFDRFLDKVRA